MRWTVKIKKLTLHNFGIYANTNTFEFSGKKPVVLIGGMNGRGKTTVLEAVLLALYGPNSFAYIESDYKTYPQYLKSYVNESDGTLSSYIELDFSIGDESNYSIKREWSSKNFRTNERIIAKKDGEVDDFLTNNWSMFFEDILPSGLSNFFFFDGEKIAEMAIDHTDKRMKESIKSLLGLGVLDILDNDLKRLISNINKTDDEFPKSNFLDALSSKKERIENNLLTIDENISLESDNLSKLEKEIESLNIEFNTKGGLIIQQREALTQERATLLGKYEQINDYLIDASGSELPLLLVPDLLNKIQNQALKEEKEKNLKTVMSQIDDLYASFSNEATISLESVDTFIRFIKTQSNKLAGNSVYNLSDHALTQLNGLCHRQLNDKSQYIKNYYQDKKNIRKRIDEIDHYLSVDVDEKKLNRIKEHINELNLKKSLKEKEIYALEKKRFQINGEKIRCTSEFNQYIDQYLSQIEMKDDNNRKLKYTHMAQQIISTYRSQLLLGKTELLSKTMTTCFNRISNKKNLIAEIHIEQDTLNFHYINHNGKEIKKSILSAGEKQLLVISLLWALSISSKKKLPVIIDTPLSRLDSNHRVSLIKNYYPFASEQTIILSTDSEIDSYYHDLLKDYIDDEFTLIYDDKLQKTTIQRGYFTGVEKC